MGDALFELREVVMAGRGGRARLAVERLRIDAGVTAVVGASGAGKTTLLNLLVGFERAEGGRVEGAGTVVKTRRFARGLAQRRRGAEGGLPVFWAPAEGGLWPHLSVRGHLQAVAPDGEREAARLDALLSMFDLTPEQHARPATLSAGQRERLAVARAVASGAGVLVLDEPLIHVEPVLARRLWRAVVEDVTGRGGSLIFSSHDPAVVLRHASRVICLQGGRVIVEGEVRALYIDPPTREVAAALGEGEWLDHADAARWLGGAVEDYPHALIVRPEHLDLTPGPDGPIRVEHTTDAGGVAQSRLMHMADGETRTFLHRPRFPALAAGSRVTLRLLTLLILLVTLATLPACGPSADDADLGVTQVNHWPVPPDGPTVPAPRSVSLGAVDEQGRRAPGGVTVLDNGGRILFYTAEGKYLHGWKTPSNEDGNPESAVWLQDGRLAIADTHYFHILFYNAAGELVGTLGTRGSGPGEFEFPSSVTQDPNGFLYVAEYGGNDRVQKFTAQGEYVLSFGSVGTGPGQLQRAMGVVWRDGIVYVADASNGRIQAFTDDGKFLRVLGTKGEPLHLSYPYDIALGPDDSLYVPEWGSGSVARVSLDGELLGRYGTRGTGVGQFRTPWGLTVTPDGRVLVADTENRRIVELMR